MMLILLAMSIIIYIQKPVPEHSSTYKHFHLTTHFYSERLAISINCLIQTFFFRMAGVLFRCRALNLQKNVTVLIIV